MYGGVYSSMIYCTSTVRKALRTSTNNASAGTKDCKQFVKLRILGREGRLHLARDEAGDTRDLTLRLCTRNPR
jgi:hypothetical protein